MDFKIKRLLIPFSIVLISVIIFFVARFLMVDDNNIKDVGTGNTIDLGVEQTSDTKPSRYVEFSGKIICLKDGSEKDGECTVGLRSNSVDYAVVGFKEADSLKIREGVKVKLSGRLQTDKMAGYPKIYIDSYEIQ